MFQNELNYYSPGHVDAAAKLDQLRRVAGAVVAEHSGQILADKQIVLPVAVVIDAADERLVGIEADAERNPVACAVGPHADRAERGAMLHDGILPGGSGQITNLFGTISHLFRNNSE